MPEHSTWLTFLLVHLRDTLQHNAANFGATLVGHRATSWRDFEPLSASLIIVLAIVGMALAVRARIVNTAEAVAPEERLTLRTFFEVFLGYFYDLAKSVMDAERAKRYFPIIGTGATFVFFCNVLALIPGMPVPTTSLNVTFGTALVVFVLFNLYGIRQNGLHYFTHMAGPVWYLWPLIFVIEFISMCVRPITLAVRLMLNMAVDHLILSIFLGLVCLLIPVPVMLLGCLVVVVQTLVFTMLTCIYIGLATEPSEGHTEHAH